MTNEQDEHARLRRYSDYDPEDRMLPVPAEAFVRFKVVVATEDDKQQLLALSKYLHDEAWHEEFTEDAPDGDIVAYNQLRHMYLEPSWIEVRPEEFKR